MDRSPTEGYPEYTAVSVELVNHMKHVEETVLRQLDKLSQEGSFDPRWLAVGRTHIEQGFMAVNRSIMQPGRVTLPGDVDENQTANTED